MTNERRIGVVGAGFSGAVIARRLAEAGAAVEVFDTRPHLAGNCHTERDAATGVMLHVYGPHIFHTSDEKVWRYVQQFDEFMPYTNRVKAHARGRVYALPVNLLTINQLFGRQFSPKQAEAHIAALAETGIAEPRTFEEQALRFVGREIYETFFRGYTRKQWGMDPSALPASILKRLPLRFSYDDNYYASTFQGLPRHGYTHIVERILDHPGISVRLSTRFARAIAQDYAHVFYSGPIDAWFDHAQGRLAYRTLDFETLRDSGDLQGNAVINYCDEDVPWTRITEHKHLTPWERHADTVAYREYSRLCGPDDIPYYPIRLAGDMAQLARYVTLARGEANVTFVGRLGTYRYLDMHISIAEALDTAELYLTARRQGLPMRPFLADPIA